ncbi:MAG: thioesterase II family protein [Pirellulales bacterium]
MKPAAEATYLRYDNGRIGLRRFRWAKPGSPRIVCLPFAGGQSLVFRALAAHLPAEWGVWAIDPPGHGWASGTPLDRVETMAEVYLACLPRELLADAVLLGHSLGGCVAFAMTERLTGSSGMPRALVLSATRPPHRASDYESFLALDDQGLLDVLIRLGGIPADWAQEPELFAQFREVVRADFRAFESFRLDGRRLDLPTLAVGAPEDIVCRPAHVFEWTRFCPASEIEFVPGGHLFVQTEPAQFAQRVASFVARLRPGAMP